MNNLWASLAPLIIGSAVVPVQIIVTILLIRASRITALAWVAGMVSVRLLQGVLFGMVWSSGDVSSADTGDGGAGMIASTLLLLAAVLFLVTAVKQFLHEDDPDAPPPKWLAMIEGLTPLKAFGVGAGLLIIGIKFWVFTMGAIAAIGDADLGQPGAIITYLVFVALTVSAHLAVIGVAFLLPAKSDALLERASTWLSDHNRILMIVLGAVFGTWFMIKALDGFGVL